MRYLDKHCKPLPGDLLLMVYNRKFSCINLCLSVKQVDDEHLLVTLMENNNVNASSIKFYQDDGKWSIIPYTGLPECYASSLAMVVQISFIE